MYKSKKKKSFYKYDFNDYNIKHTKKDDEKRFPKDLISKKIFRACNSEILFNSTINLLVQNPIKKDFKCNDIFMIFSKEKIQCFKNQEAFLNSKQPISQVLENKISLSKFLCLVMKILKILIMKS